MSHHQLLHHRSIPAADENVKSHHGRFFVVHMTVQSLRANSSDRNFTFSGIGDTEITGPAHTPELNIKARRMRLVGYSVTADSTATEYSGWSDSAYAGTSLLGVEFVGTTVHNPVTYSHGIRRRYMPLLVDFPPTAANEELRATSTARNLCDDAQWMLSTDDPLSGTMLNHFNVRLYRPDDGLGFSDALRMPPVTQLTLMFRIDEQIVSTVST